MILLTNDEETILQGVMGVGPMSAEEGFQTWENITENKFRLVDLIELQGKNESLDPELNEIVKSLKIDLAEKSYLHNIFKNGKPVHVKNGYHDDTLDIFIEKFNLKEFVIFPLINRMHKVGLLIIDNIVNKNPITNEEIDSVIPLANQAAIAIQHSHLYTQVEDMALKDGLTNLLNHRALHLTLDALYASDKHDYLSCIMLDIDFFKKYNDKNGHLLGNQVLIELANLINFSIRDNDYAFRFGGEEFLLLLPHTNIDQAREIAEQLRLHVINHEFPYSESQPGGRLSISLGVSSTNRLKVNTKNELIDTADHALYQAKSLGRNRV